MHKKQLELKESMVLAALFLVFLFMKSPCFFFLINFESGTSPDTAALP